MQKSKTNYTSQFGCALSLMSRAARAERRRMLLNVILALMLIVPTWAQTQAPAVDAGAPALDSPSRQYLLGDWGGVRSRLAEKGIVFDFFYISDSQGNPTG